MEEIFKNFENKKTEALRQMDNQEGELSVEKQKEILKEAVNEKISNAQPITQNQQQVIAQTTQKLKDEPKERQIQLLVQMAMDKGVIEAINIARNLDNPYLLDEFHDALIDYFYNQLVANEKLK